MPRIAARVVSYAVDIPDVNSTYTHQNSTLKHCGLDCENLRKLLDRTHQMKFKLIQACAFLSLLIQNSTTLASQSDQIRGTYIVQSSQLCSTVSDSSPDESSLSVETGLNGLPQVRSRAQVTPAWNFATYTMRVNPITRTMTASDIPTVRLASSGLIWQRTNRNLVITYNIDRSNDSIFVSSKRGTFVQPFDGSIAVATASGDRFRTIDRGETFFQEINPSPSIVKMTETLDSTVRYYSVVCAIQLNARRVSMQF